VAGILVLLLAGTALALLLAVLAGIELRGQPDHVLAAAALAQAADLLLQPLHRAGIAGAQLGAELAVGLGEEDGDGLARRSLQLDGDPLGRDHRRLLEGLLEDFVELAVRGQGDGPLQDGGLVLGVVHRAGRDGVSGV